MSKQLALIDFIGSSLIYVASPYTHPFPSVVEARVHAALEYTAKLLALNSFAYSPIAHCHELAKKHSLPTDFKFWSRYNAVMLSRCTSLHVLCLTGWTVSKGVQAEIKLAKNASFPIIYVNPLTFKPSTKNELKDAFDPD